MKKLSLIIILSQLFFLVLVFQNCSPGFKSNQTTESSSLSLNGESLRITSSGKARFFAELGKTMPVLVEGAAEINTAASSLKAIRGSCPANQTWAPLNQASSPWTFNLQPTGVAFLPGVNNWTYSQALDTEMGGCDWVGCVTSKAGSISCVEFLTRCQPQSLHLDSPYCTLASGLPGQNQCNAAGNGFTCAAVSSTCNPATKPADAIQTGLACSALNPATMGTYSKMTPYICNSTILIWVPGTPVNNTSTCSAVPTNCNAATKPADIIQSGLSCSAVNPATTGTYTETTSYTCNTTTLAWMPGTPVKNLTTCTASCNPATKPADTLQTGLSCSAVNPATTGTYSQSTPYVCNAMTLAWVLGTPVKNLTTCNSTCNPATKPADAVQSGLSCSAVNPATTGTYTRTTPYMCNSTTLAWMLGTPVNNLTTCTATCNPATKPVDNIQSGLSCSAVNPATTGTYTQTTSYTCNATTLAWTAGTPLKNLSTCTATCDPATKPADSSVSVSCAATNPLYSGTYFQTTTYSCNSSNLWAATSSNTFASQCQSTYPKLSTLPRNANGDVEVPFNTTAFVDANVDVSTLLIQGTLRCGGNSDNFELKAKTIIVNGTFECGTPSAPFTGNLKVSLKHNSAIIPKSGRELAGAAADPGAVNYRALIVNNNGKLVMHGRITTKMARLNATVAAGANAIVIDRAVNWQVGDEIAIAPTSFDGTEGEKFRITAINSTSIQLNGNLQHRHWGGAVENYNTQRGNVTLDQRAEVANLSRNIKIQGDDLNDTQLKFFEQDFQLGGHVMVMLGGTAQIDSVEFYKMGQAGIMARYPFHWHFAGDVPGQYLKNSSINTSFQRCVTVHGTNQALVENNVCFNFRGHGYFLEDGNEVNNVIRGNIGINAHMPFQSKVLLASDDIFQGVGRRFPAVSVFWISNPQNTITNNIAAGSVGTGFWNSFEGPFLRINTTDFSYNIAHSMPVGHTWDGARDPNQPANNPNNPGDLKLTSAHYSPAQIPRFTGLVTYKNAQAGVYFRGQTVVYDNLVAADNGWSLFLAYNQIIKNSTIIGTSQNFGPIEQNYFISNPSVAHQVGITLYDGPFELDSVDFLNFPTTTNIVTENGQQVDKTMTPIVGIGGSEKLTNFTNRLRFSPEPKYRVMVRKFVDNWADEHLSQSIRDRDGTLTGTANALLLGSERFSSAPSCTASPSFYGMKICSAATQMGTLRILSQQYGKTFGVQLPQILKRSDGEISYSPAEVSFLRSPAAVANLQNLYAKTTIVNSPNYSYEVMFLDEFTGANKNQDLLIQYYSENEVYTTSPVIKLVGYGSQCRINGGNMMLSLEYLNASNSTSYFSSGNEFYLRIRTAGPYPFVDSGQVNSGQARIQVAGVSVICDAPLVKYITGVIDSIDAAGNASGWGCNFGSAEQIAMHVYAGGPAGSGTFLTAFGAGLPSEQAVGFACGDGSGTGHRFNVKLSTTSPAVWIHGINGIDNSVIYNSGKPIPFP